MRRVKQVEEGQPKYSGSDEPFFDASPQIPGRVVKVDEGLDYSWDDIRRDFILGKRITQADGSVATTNYTLRELSEKYGICFENIRKRSAREKWSKFRKAYLARVSERNIGLEIGMYSQQNVEAEISAITACNKLNVVLQKYLDYKFGELLDSAENLNSDGEDCLSEDMEEQMNAVNRASGTPVFITELKEAVKVTQDIYKLQRSIYENAPKDEIDLDKMTGNGNKKKKFKSDQDRLQTIAKISALLFPATSPEESKADAQEG